MKNVKTKKLTHEQASRLLSECEGRHVTYNDPNMCFAAVAFNVCGTDAYDDPLYVPLRVQWWDVSSRMFDQLCERSIFDADTCLAALEAAKLV